MRVMPIKTTGYSSRNTTNGNSNFQQKNVSFKLFHTKIFNTGVTYFEPHRIVNSDYTLITQREIMSQLADNGYIIEGKDTHDAFEHFYDAVEDNLLYEARCAPKALWIKRGESGIAYSEHHLTQDEFRKIKHVAIDMPFVPTEWVDLLTAFWECNKHCDLGDSAKVVTNHLTTYYKDNPNVQPPPLLKKLFSSRPSVYELCEETLLGLNEFFLKKGKHRLK